MSSLVEASTTTMNASISVDLKKRDMQHIRKEHVNRVLSAKQAEKIKNRWNQEPEFLCAPPFHNSLPMVPMGPYFKLSNSLRPFCDFAAYSMTSLERSFVWQPHYGPDMNIKLDLVDQDSILLSDKASLLGSAESRGPGSDKPRPVRGSSQDSKKHSWLKRTIYLTNDLGEGGKKNDLAKLQSDNRKRSIGDDEGVFTSRGIETSFDWIGTRTKISLEKMKPKNSDARIEWMAPILPDGDLWRREMTLLLFDEDPEDMSYSEGNIPENPQSKNRVLNGIFTNIRQLPSENSPVNGQVIAVSLVAPVASSAVEPDGTDTEEVEYTWLRDFRTQVRQTHGLMDGTFLMQVDPAGGRALYCPLPSKLEMKRMKIEDSDQHVAHVSRQDGEQD